MNSSVWWWKWIVCALQRETADVPLVAYLQNIEVDTVSPDNRHFIWNVLPTLHANKRWPLLQNPLFHQKKWKKKTKKHGQHQWWGTQMHWDYLWWSKCIPKSPILILAHLSLFSLANTMPFVPKRIIRQRCRRQTIYWHFASLNSNVSLPGTIHFKQYVCCTFLGSPYLPASREALQLSQVLK